MVFKLGIPLQKSSKDFIESRITIVFDLLHDNVQNIKEVCAKLSENGNHLTTQPWLEQQHQIVER